MTTYLSSPLRAAMLAFATAAAMFVTGDVSRASVPVDLRVVAPGGASLTDQTQHTGTTKIKTDRRADCFGKDNRGSGKRVRVRGATALGVVADATAVRRRLRPLSVTDAFDFGLGVCGIGGFDFESGDTAFWYFKVNHANPQLGADQVALERGDEVLWYLTPSYESLPAELALDAPARARAGKPFKVRVVEYSDDGKRRPAEGVDVTGAAEPTDASGTTTVTLARSDKIRADRDSDGAIPDYAKVCVAAAKNDCPAQPGTLIGGSAKRDAIVGTRGPDRIVARRGRDSIDATDGSRDVVKCGKGKDVVTADAVDSLKGCERAKR